jgi:hypothetical protein
MTRDFGRLRAAMATLLVASALLFVVGIFIERGTGSAATPRGEAAIPPATASVAPHVEGSGESGENGGEAGESHTPGASATESGGEATGHTETGSGEAIFGIDPETPGLVAFAVIVSLLVAFLVWRDGRRPVIAGAVVLALGFAALDLLEVSHQAREGTALLVVIAALVAIGHLLATGVGVAILRRSAIA